MAAALAFSAGILFARFVWHPYWMWIAAGLLIGCGAAFLSRTRPRIAYCAALVCFALVGSFAGSARDVAHRPDTSLLQFASGSEVTITANVLRDGVWRESAYGGREQSLDVHIESLSDSGSTHVVSGGARLTLFARHKSRRVATDDDAEEDAQPSAAEPFQTYRYGQRLRLIAKLHRPLNYGNPGAFDYRGYLLSHGLVAVGSARAESIGVLPGLSGTRMQSLRWRVRRSILEHIHRTWPPDRAALMDAMLIGERAFVTRELRESFQRSGTYHILVVSGMNVGILAFVVFWLLRRFRIGAALATAITVLLACAYAYVADAGAPIIRSALMLAVYLVARLLYRDRAPLNAVGIAALTILVADPRSLFDPSFQLTFLSVAAIAGIGIPIIERTSEPYQRATRILDLVEYDATVAPRLAQFRLDLRLIISRLARFLGGRLSRMLIVGLISAALSAYELLLISALMQVSLALPMAWYFHRATSMALPANILVVPLTGVLMPSAVAAIALSYIWQPLAHVPAAVAALSLDAITGTVRLLGALRVADVRVPMPTFTVAIAAALAIAAAIVLARRHRVVAAIALTLLTVSALSTAWPRPVERRAGTLEITAIDVGQGDSFLVITPEGKSLLIDAGGQFGNSNSEFDVGEDVVSPYLWQRGINSLDAVAISHAHSDHMGGMKAVIRNFHPRELWMGRSAPAAGLEALRQTARENGVLIVQRTAGEQFHFGGADFEVFAPTPDWELKTRVRDDDAMVLRVSYGSNSALFPGDAGRKLEQQLASKLPASDLLKIPHHGSATSTSPELLDAVRPKFAVISVGARNSFKHPRAEVLARLQAAHVATFRTDTMGAVSFYLDGSTIRAERVPRR